MRDVVLFCALRSVWCFFPAPALRHHITLASSLAEEVETYAASGSVFSATTCEGFDVATFAGGCFWGLQLAFDREPGVVDSVVGYTQGIVEHPSYGQVCDESTGHTEAVLVSYDSERLSFGRLAELLFDTVGDPTTLNRVGRDRGTNYRTGIYAHDDDTLRLAGIAFDVENRSWKSSGRPVVTEVERAAVFYPAEAAHQRYLKNGGRFGRPQSDDKGCADAIRCYG